MHFNPKPNSLGDVQTPKSRINKPTPAMSKALEAKKENKKAHKRIKKSGVDFNKA